MSKLSLKKKDDPLVLVFCSDDHYSILLAVAMHSALVHLENDCPISIYVVDGGISEINKRRIDKVADLSRKNPKLEWVNPDYSLLKDLSIYGNVTFSTYLDLMIPHLLPERFNKAIYLDCDLQVETSLSKLWQEDIGDNAILAVQSFVTPSVSSPGGLPNYSELGYTPDTPYFNAGVLVLNLKKWREEEITHRVIEQQRQSGRYLEKIYEEDGYIVSEQYGLNAVLADDWRRLDPKWNVMSTIFYLKHEKGKTSPYQKELINRRAELLHHPYILHFTGPKPWKLECSHPGKVKWRHYLSESGWFEPLNLKGLKGKSKEKIIKDQKRSSSSKPRVTIAIPTFNRPQLLRNCLESVIAQEFTDFHVLILDNSAKGATEKIVKSFADQRINYSRNETDLGLFGNWVRALDLYSSPYIAIFHESDRMLPNFVSDSVSILDNHPEAAFSFCSASFIDYRGNPLNRKDKSDIPHGVMDGLGYLHHIVAGSLGITQPSTVMMRSSALADIGQIEPEHSRQFFDMNLFIRLASKSDVAFINQPLVQIRLYPERDKESDFIAIEGTEQLATVAEITDAIAYLLQSKRGNDETYRGLLTENLLAVNRRNSNLIRHLVPSLEFTFSDLLEIARREILAVIPSGSSFILVDRYIFYDKIFPDRNVLPFLERGGESWGNPPDDDTAIKELERMRKAGVGFMVIAWWEFWWLDYYSRFFDYLRSNFPCLINNERLLIFDLR
jgi:lipopolysaccharide biosynthesis glycosyltransferase